MLVALAVDDDDLMLRVTVVVARIEARGTVLVVPLQMIRPRVEQAGMVLVMVMIPVVKELSVVVVDVGAMVTVDGKVDVGRTVRVDVEEVVVVGTEVVTTVVVGVKEEDGLADDGHALLEAVKVVVVQSVHDSTQIKCMGTPGTCSGHARHPSRIVRTRPQKKSPPFPLTRIRRHRVNPAASPLVHVGSGPGKHGAKTCQ